MQPVNDQQYDDIFHLSIPAPALDIVIFTIYRDELALLFLRGEDGKYSLPGGIVRSGESLEETFDRVLKAKTNVEGVYKEQLYTFGDPKRDRRGHVLSIVYYALFSADTLYHDADLTRVAIVPFSQLSKANCLYDHFEIISYAYQRLGYKLEYTNVAQNILPGKFTLSQLQRTYEIILARTIDKRNFRKKILSLGIVQELSEKSTAGSKRPAALYEFVQKDMQVVEMGKGF